LRAAARLDAKHLDKYCEKRNNHRMINFVICPASSPDVRACLLSGISHEFQEFRNSRRPHEPHESHEKVPLKQQYRCDSRKLMRTCFLNRAGGAEAESGKPKRNACVPGIEGFPPMWEAWEIVRSLS
jgi:hypothetical protein